mmetsp:Transcript_36747/g.105969  ORF Transcript_36747/g.105969 Transcript_36747/m.105969 type:complete len:257 (-) Transcript_36747:80-850(-)
MRHDEALQPPGDGPGVRARPHGVDEVSLHGGSRPRPSAQGRHQQLRDGASEVDHAQENLDEHQAPWRALRTAAQREEKDHRGHEERTMAPMLRLAEQLTEVQKVQPEAREEEETRREATVASQEERHQQAGPGQVERLNVQAWYREDAVRLAAVICQTAHVCGRDLNFGEPLVEARGRPVVDRKACRHGETIKENEEPHLLGRLAQEKWLQHGLRVDAHLRDLAKQRVGNVGCPESAQREHIAPQTRCLGGLHQAR